MLAGELSADSFGNPQNARVKRLIGARSVVVGQTMPFVFLFGRHSDAPSSGPSNEKQRGSAERKSESRAVVAERKETCCWRSLHVGRQYPNTFQRTVVRREGDALPRIGSVLHFLRKSDPNSALSAAFIAHSLIAVDHAALSGRTNWRHGPACAQVAETSAAQALLYKHCSHAPASARCATRLFAIVQALWR